MTARATMLVANYANRLEEQYADLLASFIITGEIKSSEERIRRVTEFNAGNLGKVFVSTDAGAYGLNAQQQQAANQSQLQNQASNLQGLMQLGSAAMMFL